MLGSGVELLTIVPLVPECLLTAGERCSPDSPRSDVWCVVKVNSCHQDSGQLFRPDLIVCTSTGSPSPVCHHENLIMDFNVVKRRIRSQRTCALRFMTG